MKEKVSSFVLLVLSLPLVVVSLGCGQFHAEQAKNNPGGAGSALGFSSLNAKGIVCPNREVKVICDDDQTSITLTNEYGCSYNACADKGIDLSVGSNADEDLVCPQTLNPSCSSFQNVMSTRDRFGCEVKTCADQDGLYNPLASLQNGIDLEELKAPLGHKVAVITDGGTTEQAFVPHFCGGMTYDDYLSDSRICQAQGKSLTYRYQIESSDFVSQFTGGGFLNTIQ
ncbi:MAG: hypothetical protein AAF202_07775, partial [Pseudomonadota bacterium]